jgi:hypothetical protein
LFGQLNFFYHTKPAQVATPDHNKATMLSHVLLSLFLAQTVLASPPSFPTCYLYSTNNEYFLTGPIQWPEAALACQYAGGDLAAIYAHNKNDEAMQKYLDIRRGMRACNNTVKAWITDIDVGGNYIIPPPMRMLTIHGMVDAQISDAQKEFMALCHITS